MQNYFYFTNCLKSGFYTFLLTLLLTTFASSESLIKSHGISNFGDLKYPADFDFLEYVNSTAPKAGEISTWAFGTFDSLNRYIVKGNAAGSGNISIETLMTGTADEPDALYGLLAESIEYPEDRSYVIFNLRPEAKFSDGSKVTAADVVFSHYVLLEKGIPSLKQIFSGIEKVEELSKNKVKFTFKEPSDNNELLMLAASSSVFSKNFFSTRDFSESSLEPMLGSGPYVLDEIEVGKRLVYKLNETYWGKHLSINQGRNNFKKIRYEYYADTTAAFEGFKAGEYTFRSENSSQKWAQDYNFPAISEGIIKKESLPDGNLGAAQAFFFNIRLEKFKNPKVREALGLMFNFEWSNKTLFFGLYDRVTSFWENSEMKASGMISEPELKVLKPFQKYLPEKIFNQPAYVPPKSSPNKVDRKNRRKAGKLLTEAGWVLKNGLRENAAGENFKLEILNYSPAFDRIINPFVENLKLLGIDAKHTRIDSTQYTERVRSFDWEIITSTYGNSMTPGLDLVQKFSSETADIPSRNLVGLKNNGIDGLVKLATQANSRKELNNIIRGLDRSLRAMHLWIPQWYKNVHTVAYRDQYSYPKALPPFDLGAFDFWWYDEKKAIKISGK